MQKEEHILKDYPNFDPEYQDALDMIKYYNGTQEFWDLVHTQDYQKLYQFILQYGLYKLFKYLYEIQRIPFDMKILQEFYQTLQADPYNQKDANIQVPIQTGLTNQSVFHIKVEDKFTLGRNEILKYFNRVKRRSRYMPGKCRYMYIYNGRGTII